MDAIKANAVVEHTLCEANRHISDMLRAEILAISAPMDFGLDDVIKNEIENVVEDQSNHSHKKLVVMLETVGGYIEVVERIVSVFRRHYKQVEFIIPNFAYSAGTVLGPVDKLIGPEADGCDVYEAEIAC